MGPGHVISGRGASYRLVGAVIKPNHPYPRLICGFSKGQLAGERHEGFEILWWHPRQGTGYLPSDFSWLFHCLAAT